MKPNFEETNIFPGFLVGKNFFMMNYQINWLTHHFEIEAMMGPRHCYSTLKILLYCTIKAQRIQEKRW